jgi:hypothetical protein
MTGTSLPDVSPAIPPPYPRGYTLQGIPPHTNPVDATDWNPSFGWTAGGMISTVDDLLVYDRALGTGQGLVTHPTQVARLTSWPEPAGYGFALGCVDGWVGHTGELPGFNTALYYDTTSDTSVVVLVNSDISSGACTESPTLTDNQTDVPCSSPATRVFVGLSEALGHPFTPLPASDCYSDSIPTSFMELPNAAAGVPACSYALPIMTARPVIIGFDGSPTSQRAVREAAALFAPRRALVAVVWEAGRAFEAATTPALEAPPVTLEIPAALAADQDAAEAAKRTAQHGVALAKDPRPRGDRPGRGRTTAPWPTR